MKKLLFLLSILTLLSSTYGQGCSDAGFCTMGAMRPDQHFEPNNKIKLRSLELNQYLGISRFNDIIHATTIDFNVEISKKLGAQIKIPYMAIDGPLGKNHGFGDISFSSTYTLYSSEKGQVNYTIGGKAPTNKANAKRDDASLPMYYQTSLGTIDFVSGISFITKGWLFATGYQRVIADYNENNFSWSPWGSMGLLEEAQQYHSSINLQRNQDIMFRVEKNFHFSKFNFHIGLLDIIRLGEDKVDSPSTGEQVLVEDENGTSKGHAVTLLYGIGYNLNVHSSLKFLMGNRLIKRHYNADGLSRECVISTSYVIKF